MKEIWMDWNMVGLLFCVAAAVFILVTATQTVIRILKSKVVILAITSILCAGMAKAQTCTPITVSYPNSAPHDDGKGPGFGLSFDGTVYGSGTTVTKPAPQYGVYGVGAIGAQGYVNDLGGFGGCPPSVSWSWEMQTYSEVIDVTANKVVYGPTPQYSGPEQACGNVQNCHFDLWDNRWENVPFISGHTYYFYGWMDALWIPLPGSGHGEASSPQYEGYIKIIIE